mmetsp:Transcript_2092/g.9173  ORF Transcript_2092/g.9173 Transcript_2092/m.9173 type:complete len:89 (-) Transcript_2092:1954-2220(-)
MVARWSDDVHRPVVAQLKDCPYGQMFMRWASPRVAEYSKHPLEQLQAQFKSDSVCARRMPSFRPWGGAGASAKRYKSRQAAKNLRGES